MTEDSFLNDLLIKFEQKYRNMIRAYATIIVRHPCIILMVVMTTSITCSLIPIFTRTFPSFSDPILGFETRGTNLANRFLSWENLLEETRPSKSLAVNPQDIIDELRYNTRNISRNKILHNGKKHKTKVTRIKNAKTVSDLSNLDFSENNNISSHKHWDYGKNISYTDDRNQVNEKSKYMRNQWKKLQNFDIPVGKKKPNGVDSYFCGSPLVDYAHLVLTTQDGSSLMEMHNIRNACRLQTNLVQLGNNTYTHLCQRKMSDETTCCPVWSLPNYIALLSDKTSCMDITEDDVLNVINLLQMCAPYFHSLELAAACELEHCATPSECFVHNAVYNILFYLTDIYFLPPENNTNTVLNNAMIFLPLACSSTSISYYNLIRNIDLQNGLVQVSAMELGVKNAVFDQWLIHDTWLIAMGGLFVLVSVWIYTGSFLLTVFLFMSIIFSLGIAYFFYASVYNLEFFPFMNLLVIVVVIGMGADDAFIYVKVWQVKKLQLLGSCKRAETVNSFTKLDNKDESVLINLVYETLRHTILTMFVTTLTTAIAFFASYVSFVTAINCFSIFAGTAVLANFLLMVTWLPSAVFLIDNHCNFIKNEKLLLAFKPIRDAVDEMWTFLNRFLMVSVIRFRIFWPVTFSVVSIVSLLIIFFYPGLQLPDTKHFQLFQPNHPFEQYDVKYQDKFIFDRLGREWGIGSKMPLRWIWGVQALDNGDHMNPASKGHLVFDESFNISSPESQIWLSNFCIRLKAETFYQSTLGPLLPNCFIESFKMWMSRKCVDEIDNIDRAPCCELSTFPYSSHVFDYCIVLAMSALYQTPRELFTPGVAGPKFRRGEDPPRVVALVIEFESTQSFSMSYEEMHHFYTAVENWTVSQLISAPPGMKGGWFLSELQFYDLQSTLAKGTITAVVLSAGLGLSVLLPSTFSIMISFCAVLSMMCAVVVTVAILVLLGWKLNALESVAISTSVGLAVDFNLHYALSFTFASGTKMSRAASALTASAGPTVAAALTTGIAGAAMLPSLVMPYFQIGTFLVLIMSVSWLYSTFFLCPILSVCKVKDKVRPPGKKRLAPRRTVRSNIPISENHLLECLAELQSAQDMARPQSPSAASATTVVLHEEIESVNFINNKQTHSK